MNFDNICEMDIADLLQSVIGVKDGANTEPQSCSVENPIQPNDNVGEFGNATDIQIKTTPEGGIEVDSKEMAIKISKDVFEAIKMFITKGDE